MRIEHLEECIDLSKSLNFTQTAAHFYIAQPALSKHISGLESELGIQIFFRDQHRVRLTEVGRHFIQDAKLVVDAYYKALENAERYRGQSSDCLHVGYLYGAATMCIPAIQDAFMEIYPACNVRYYAKDVTDIESDLIDNKLDAAFTTLTTELTSERFCHEIIFRDSYCAVVADGHRLSTKEFVSLGDFEGEHVALPSHAYQPEEALRIRHYLSPIGESVDYRTSLQDMHSMPFAVNVEGCIGIVPAHLKNFYHAKLNFIPIEDYPNSFMLALVWKRNNENEGLLRFKDIAVDIMADSEYLPADGRFVFNK